MNKKAKVIMEFLMTYGWAIIVVIGAIIILMTFGLFDLNDYHKIAVDKCAERNLDLWVYEENSERIRFNCKNITESWDFIFNKSELKNYNHDDFKELINNKSI